MSWLSDIGDFIKPVTTELSANKSWLGPVANAGLGYLNDQNRAGTANNVANIYQQMEADRAKQTNDYNQYVYQNNLAMAQNSAANSAANAAAANAAANARANAAMQTEANRQRAEQAGLKVEQKRFDLAQGYLDPYVKSAATLVPKITKVYGGGLDSLDTLNHWLMRPDMLAATQQYTPSYAINIPLAASLKGG